MKLPKFRMTPLYGGYTYQQFLIILVFIGIYGLLFPFLAGLMGILKSLIAGIAFIGAPAMFLKVTNASPNMKMVEKLNFWLVKPILYLSGKRGK